LPQPVPDAPVRFLSSKRNAKREPLIFLGFFATVTRPDPAGRYKIAFVSAEIAMLEKAPALA
jgi:hypothetical protein